MSKNNEKISTKNPMALSIDQAAEMLNLSATFTRQMVYSGVIPAVKIGRRWIIPVKALEQWLNQQAANE